MTASVNLTTSCGGEFLNEAKPESMTHLEKTTQLQMFNFLL